MSDNTEQNVVLRDETAADTELRASEPTRPQEPATVREPRPRIRFGAIAWGLIVCGIAATTLAVVGDPQRRDDFGNWLLQLDGRAAVNIAVLAFGALVLLLGLLAVIRRAQRAR